jgi:pimeloyl-ACP methyl ester carboxylesterase
MAHINSKDWTGIGFEKVGTGPLLVLVDGALAFREFRGSRQLAAELAERFSVVSYDRRGRGESSDTAPYAVEREIEDIEALVDAHGGRASLYGFSSGAVLALRAAAALGEKVERVVVLEPPFNPDDEESKSASLSYAKQMAALLDEGKRGEAVKFFLADMLPPDVLSEVERSPEFQIMEAVAPTLAHDNAVMGDGAVPQALAQEVSIPVLVLDGAESPDFKHAAADALAAALPNATRVTLPNQNTLVEPSVLAPVIADFILGALRGPVRGTAPASQTQ